MKSNYIKYNPIKSQERIREIIDENETVADVWWGDPNVHPIATICTPGHGSKWWVRAYYISCSVFSPRPEWKMIHGRVWKRVHWSSWGWHDLSQLCDILWLYAQRWVWWPNRASEGLLFRRIGFCDWIQCLRCVMITPRISTIRIVNFQFCI